MSLNPFNQIQSFPTAEMFVQRLKHPFQTESSSNLVALVSVTKLSQQNKSVTESGAGVVSLVSVSAQTKITNLQSDGATPNINLASCINLINQNKSLADNQISNVSAVSVSVLTQTNQTGTSGTNNPTAAVSLVSVNSI